MDVFEFPDRLVVAVEVPGLPPEALRVVYRERELVLAGERRARRMGPGATYHCLERPHGRFERTIPLDVAVDKLLGRHRGRGVGRHARDLARRRGDVVAGQGQRRRAVCDPHGARGRPS